jgi:hypothetical protein
MSAPLGRLERLPAREGWSGHRPQTPPDRAAPVTHVGDAAVDGLAQPTRPGGEQPDTGRGEPGIRSTSRPTRSSIRRSRRRRPSGNAAPQESRAGARRALGGVGGGALGREAGAQELIGAPVGPRRLCPRV